MSSRYLHPESYKRSQSKSKASLDDFDRQTLYSKIMVNLGTNPFMDTIQSPSCSSIQEYISHYDEINNFRQNEQNVEQVALKKNQINEYLQKPPSHMINSSPHSTKPSGPFQKKNLKKLLNKSKKESSNSDYDFTMQDSITDENPNIETKVQELNNNQTCNFTKFEILKKKNDKLIQESVQGNSGNITMIKKPPLTSQESAQNTQSTQVYLNSPCIKSIEKTQTPKSYKVNMEDLSQNNLSPFQYDQAIMNTNNSQKNSTFLQKTNLSYMPVDNLIENQEINNNQLHVINLNSQGAVNELKKVNQISTDTNQLQNQYNVSSNQQIHQSQINYQSQNNQIINSPILQSSQILQSQQQIYQSMFQTITNSQQNNQQKINENFYETNTNIPVCKSFLNQFESQQAKLCSPDNMNHFYSKQEGQYPSNQQFQANQIDHIQSPLSQITTKQISQDDKITNINSPKNNQSNNITVFNSGEAALFQNNFANNSYSNPNKFFTISSNLSLSNYQARQQQNTIQPYYNSLSYIQNQGQKRGDTNYNNYMNLGSKDILNSNLQEKSGNIYSQNDGKINSISYQQLNQLKQSQINSLNNSITNSQMLNLVYSNQKDPSSFNHQEQLNLLQIQQRLADNKNQIEDISLKISAQLKNCQDSFSESKKIQESNSNNSCIIQNSFVKEANISQGQPIKREKENPITRLRNKSQPNVHRAIYKSPNYQPMLFAKKEDNLTSKRPFNLKSDMSSLLYNEEEKIKKSSKFPQTDTQNKDDQQLIHQKNLFPFQMNEEKVENNFKDPSVDTYAANQVSVIQNSMQAQQVGNSFILQSNNLHINEQQKTAKQLQTFQTSSNPTYEQKPNNYTEFKANENNTNSSTRIPINNKTNQKERVSPIGNKEKIQRSQSQKDVIQNQQKNNSFSTQKNQPTPQKQRYVSQYTPSYKQQTYNVGSYNHIYIPPDNIQNTSKKANENKSINNPSEQKFQQPESPLKSVEPYSPFNTNRNSTSFIYDLNSFKNIQSSLSVAQYQQQQQQQLGQVQQQQQNQHQQQENIQISASKEQSKTQLASSHNKVDKNGSSKQANQVYNNHINLNNTKSISNLTNNPRVLNEQSFNIKKQLNQQIDKKLKTSQADQNSYKKELPKNPITCMRIHQKSNSISGQLQGTNKFSTSQNSIK